MKSVKALAFICLASLPGDFAARTDMKEIGSIISGKSKVKPVPAEQSIAGSEFTELAKAGIPQDIVGSQFTELAKTATHQENREIKTSSLLESQDHSQDVLQEMGRACCRVAKAVLTSSAPITSTWNEEVKHKGTLIYLADDEKMREFGMEDLSGDPGDHSKIFNVQLPRSNPSPWFCTMSPRCRGWTYKVDGMDLKIKTSTINWFAKAEVPPNVTSQDCEQVSPCGDASDVKLVMGNLLKLGQEVKPTNLPRMWNRYEEHGGGFDSAKFRWGDPFWAYKPLDVPVMSEKQQEARKAQEAAKPGAY